MFGMEHEEVAKYDSLQGDYQGKYIGLRKTLKLLNFGQSFIQTTGLGVSVIFAAFATARGQLTPGDFILVNAYVIQLFQPLFVSSTLLWSTSLYMFAFLPMLLTFFLFILSSVPWLHVSSNHTSSDRP